VIFDRKLKKILLVQDKKYQLIVLANLLLELGYKIEAAENGYEAIKLLSKNDFNYDLAIIDLHIPIINGFELVSEIRKRKNFPIIALTSSYKREEDISKLNELNVNEFFYSCTPFEDLIYSIDQVFISKEMDRRKTIRKIVTCPVLFKIDENWCKGETFNLTNQGAFITALNIPKVGTELELKLKLPTFSEEITLKARVIHTYKSSSVPEIMNRSGMGVIFSEMNENDKKKIQRCLAN
jgi:CheY-like chemotaxis protein